MRDHLFKTLNKTPGGLLNFERGLFFFFPKFLLLKPNGAGSLFHGILALLAFIKS